MIVTVTNHNEPDNIDAVTEEAKFELDAEFRKQLDYDVEPSAYSNHNALNNKITPRPKPSPMVTLSSRVAMVTQTLKLACKKIVKSTWLNLTIMS